MAEVDHSSSMAMSATAGHWTAYALLLGDSLDDALAFGRAAAVYDNAIHHLSRRIVNAMRFLADDKKTSEQNGSPITTMNDLLLMGRSFNAKPMAFQQN